MPYWLYDLTVILAIVVVAAQMALLLGREPP